MLHHKRGLIYRKWRHFGPHFDRVAAGGGGGVMCRGGGGGPHFDRVASLLAPGMFFNEAIPAL